MGIKDTGAYDVNRFNVNVPKDTETILPDVIGTTEMSEEDGCNLIMDGDDK